MATDFQRFLERLAEHEVQFVIAGGVALVLQGSARVTRDLAICYSRDADNLRRLSSALADVSPALRDAPADLPFTIDQPTLKAGLNFTLRTTIGDIDLLAEVSGVGGYGEVSATADIQTVYGRRKSW
jgi:hypothetical protein